MDKPKLLSDEELEALLGIEFRLTYSGHVTEYQMVAQAQLDACYKETFGQFKDFINNLDTSGDKWSVLDRIIDYLNPFKPS